MEEHHQAGLFYLTALTVSNYRSVTASFAMQGDIILAETKSYQQLVGKRVVEQNH